MPSEVALVPIYSTLKALMVAYAPLTALLAAKPAAAGGGPAVYDEGGVPQTVTSTATSMPYVTIGAGTQNPFHTMGGPSAPKYGWNCTLQIKVVGTSQESAGLNIMSKVAELFYHGRELNVSGYNSAWCDEFSVVPTLVTTGAIGVVREFPAILRVIVHDS